MEYRHILAFLVMLSFLSVPALAQTQSHPLSQIIPIDANLDMNDRNITNASYVGIGVTSPSYVLQVNDGDAYIATSGQKYRINAGGGNIGWLGSTGGGLEIESGASSWGINFTQASTPKIQILAPYSLLHTAEGNITIGDGGSNNAEIGALRFSTDATSTRWGGIQGFRGLDGATIDLRFFTMAGDSEGITERMRILSGGGVNVMGNVNISGSAPNTGVNLTLINAYSNPGYTRVVAYEDSSGFGIFGNGQITQLGTTSIADYTSRGSVAFRGIAAADSNSYFDFSLSPSGSNPQTLTSIMRLFTSGNVGIGTTSNSRTLYVNDIDSDAVIALNSSSSYDPWIGFFVDGSQKYALWRDRSDGSFNLVDTAFASTNKLITVASSGKVGINESSPDYSLHVTGVAPRAFVEGTRNGDNVAYIMQALASDGTARGGGYYLQPGTTDASTYLGLSADNSNYHMVVTRGSRVGIGTTTPQDTLEVIAGGAEGVHIRSASRPLIFFNMTGAATTQGWGIEVTNEGEVGCAGCLGVREDTKSGSIRFVIQNETGNVGIDVFSPTNKLHVVSSGSAVTTDSAEILRIQNSGSSTNAARLSIIGGNAGESAIRFGDTDSRSVGAIYYDHSTNNMTFWTNSGLAATITSLGRLGLGNFGSLSPNRMLDLVDGSIQMRHNNGIFWWNSNVDNAAMGFINFSAPGGVGGRLIFGTNGGEAMRIEDNRRIGVGITTPSQTFAVAGSGCVGDSEADCDAASTTAGNMYAKTRTGGAIDVAEWIKFTGTKPQPGDLLCVVSTNDIDAGGVVEICNEEKSRRVVGIVSTKPHLTIGQEYSGEDAVVMAISGRVPVNVEGDVDVGDILVSSSNGRAKACSVSCEGSIIGKAVTGIDNGQVLVLVSIG